MEAIVEPFRFLILRFCTPFVHQNKKMKEKKAVRDAQPSLNQRFALSG
jgi:hypothetical protein